MKQSVNAFLLVVFTASFVNTFGAIKDDILALTGNKRTKIVWSREVGAVNHPYGIGGTFRLMRFDTDVGTEADVLGTAGAYFRAKITWDGNTIVYDKASDLYAVNFDGTNNRLIATNMALGTLWYDEQTGKQYAVVQVGQGCLTDYATSSSAPMYKVNIADPADRVLIFSGSCNQIWLSISRDGKKLGGSFPWSASGGIWDIAGGTLLNFDQYGCWACTPPDNSYRFCIYPDDTHHGWQVFNADKSNSRFVALNTSAWINGYPTHNARFAINDPGYVTVNGPFDAGGKNDNSIATGSPNVEITFGKFDAGLTAVIGWARVTNNTVADYMACAWIAQTGVQDVLLFGLPGLFTSWEKLAAAREAVRPDLEKQFEAKGFTVVGLGDVGALKEMTSGFEIHHPSDLRGKGVFYYAGDPITPRVFSAIGGITPKQLNITEVLQNLTNGSVNVLMAPPFAAEQLQWASRVDHISTQTLAYAVGALIMSTSRLNSLPPGAKEAILAKGRDTTKELNKKVRDLDAQAFARLKATKKAYEPSPADVAEWTPIFIQVSKQLRGTVFTPALFDKVVQIADNPLAKLN